MSALLEVLGAREDEISLAFIENLEQANCPTLVQTQIGSYGAILDAVRSCCRDADEAAGCAWAEALRDEAAVLAVPCREVLAGLSCFERAVEFNIVKAVNQKTVLVSALAELNGVVDRLRRCYVDTRVAPPEDHTQHKLDLVALADSVDVFICMATLHGKPFYLNPAGCRLVGLDEDAPALSTSLHDLYTEASWAELRDVAVPAVKERGQWRGQSRLRNAKTGELHLVLTDMLLVKRLHIDRPYCLAVIHRDAGAGVPNLNP